MFTRTIYTEINGFGFAQLREMAPDVKIQMFHPTLGTPVSTDELEALLIQAGTETHIYVLNEQMKADLVKALTGGLQIASAVDMPGASKVTI